jgi:uncharacterized membrane protein YqjE
MLTLLLVTGLLFSLVSLVLSSWPKYSHVNSITCDRVLFLWFFLHGLSIHMLTLLLVTELLFSLVSLVLSSWPKYSHVNSITCDRVVVFSCFSGSVLMA